MNANKIILISSSSYVALFLLGYLYYSRMTFTGDAAGKGLASGLTFLLGLFILFVVGVVLLIVIRSSFSAASQVWLKFIFFIPIILPLLVFGHEVLEIGKPGPPELGEPYWLTFEFRTSEELTETFLATRFSEGLSSSSKLLHPDHEGEYYYYRYTIGIHPDPDRVFFLRSGNFKTEEYKLPIPTEPESAPFTDWELHYDGSNPAMPARVEFRYSVAKYDPR